MPEHPIENQTRPPDPPHEDDQDEREFHDEMLRGKDEALVLLRDIKAALTANTEAIENLALAIQNRGT